MCRKFVYGGKKGEENVLRFCINRGKFPGVIKSCVFCCCGMYSLFSGSDWATLPRKKKELSIVENKQIFFPSHFLQLD